MEKHYGSGDGKGRIMNPETIVEVGENSYMEMDTAQIKGVDSTIRKTTVKLDKNASVKVMERLMTHGEQRAESRFVVDLNGENSGANIISRSVAKDNYISCCNLLLNGRSKNAADIQNVMQLLWEMRKSVPFLKLLPTTLTQRLFMRLLSEEVRRRADYSPDDSGTDRGRSGRRIYQSILK